MSLAFLKNCNPVWPSTHTRTCTSCHQPKPLDEFYVDKGNRRKSQCKRCCIERQMKWYAKL